MREIKFRGKSLKTQEWLYGSHFTDSGEDYIIPQDLLGINDYEEYQADQNTVGQFTGLLDDNGKEIYEGDVIRLFGVLRAPCVVVKFFWDGFFSERPNGNLCPLRKELMIGSPGNIIGNIHDNPELIGKVVIL